MILSPKGRCKGGMRNGLATCIASICCLHQSILRRTWLSSAAGLEAISLLLTGLPSSQDHSWLGLEHNGGRSST